MLDKSQRTGKCSSADFLANQGGPTMIDANHAISHNKVMIIDGETVIRGVSILRKLSRRRTPRTCAASAAESSATQLPRLLRYRVRTQLIPAGDGLHIPTGRGECRLLGTGGQGSND
jgi:hypothetical protein